MILKKRPGFLNISCFKSTPECACGIIFIGVCIANSRHGAHMPIKDGKDCNGIGIIKTKSSADRYGIRNPAFLYATI